MENDEIQLSPLSRLRMSFNSELNLDKDGVFNREVYEGYLQMQRRVEEKQDRMGRSLFTTNALLFLMLTGQNWRIPIFNVEVSSIPAAVEILLFASALSFFFLCSIFVTNQCYNAIIEQCGNRIVDSTRIDPEFYNASKKHFDFFLKVFRSKLNIWGPDFFEHGRPFSIFAWSLDKAFLLVLLVIPAPHFIITCVGALHVYQSDLNAYAALLLIGGFGFINLLGLVMVIALYKQFSFRLAKPLDQTPNELETSNEGKPSS